MLQEVHTGTRNLDEYRTSAGDEVVDDLCALGHKLRGLRVAHLSATPYGGGVAEILRSEVPLLQSVGLDVSWKIITGDDQFFSVTKTIHNALQGADRVLTTNEQETFLAYSARNARLLESDYDVVIVHDPQPMAVPALFEADHIRWIWRCHIDTSEPNLAVWDFVRPFLEPYDAAVFTLGGFVPPEFPSTRVEIIPPAIDSESPKNFDIGDAVARRVLSWIGVDVVSPLVTQISRFDPWKDPLGVIAAYRLAREEVPTLQLVLSGSMALDDPEGWDMYRQIQDEAAHDDGIRLFTNLTGVGNIEVNALQRLSDVVVQKSVREGFGLVVSESLWKRTPVVAGRAGGIPLQLPNGSGGFLVDSLEECATRLVELLGDPELRTTLGEQGRETVRRRFLLPRLLADELRLLDSVVNGAPPRHAHPSASGVAGEIRDPVCGMRIDPATTRHLAIDGRKFWFCSAGCMAEFSNDADRYLRGAAASPPEGVRQP